MTKSKGCCPIELAAGVLLMSMAALAYEIVLTRILGVTLGLQVGLLAVSIALFGLTGGAMLVYGLPGFFAPDRAAHRMALAAAGFAVLTPVSFAIYLRCWGARTFVVLDVLGSWEGLAALAADNREKRFYLTLSGEERGHYMRIMDSIQYLTDPVGWFYVKQGSMVDGG